MTIIQRDANPWQVSAADSVQPASLFTHKRSNDPEPVTLTLTGIHTSRPAIAPGTWDVKACKLEKPAHLQLWSPAVYAPGATRSKEAVQSVTFLVFDLDGTKQRPLTTQDWLTLRDIAPKAGLCAIQTTYNHTPERPRLRIVYALSRHMTAAEHGTVWQYVGAHLDAALGFAAVDPATKDASRLYYVPVVPTQQAADWYGSELLGGAPLDVDAVLAAAALQPAPQLPAPRAQLPAPTQTPALPAPAKAANDNTPQSEILSRLLHSPMAQPSKGYRCDDPTHAEASFIDACQRHEIAEQGNGGHSRLLGLANIGVIGYALDPGVAAQIAWDHYNPRCAPPWSDNEFREFERKFKETKPQGDAQYGYLLGNGGVAPAPQLPPALQQQAQEIAQHVTAPANAPPVNASEAPSTVAGLVADATRYREAMAELDPLLTQYLESECSGGDSSVYAARLSEIQNIVGPEHYAKQFAAAVARGIPVDKFAERAAKWRRRPGDPIVKRPALCKTLGLKPGAPCMVSARGGVGKSWLANTLMAQTEAGLPLLGLHELTPSPDAKGVVLINLEVEEDLTDLRWRMTYTALGRDYMTADVETWNLPQWAFNGRDDSELARDLTAALQGKRLAVVDPLTVLYPGGKENDTEFRAVLDFLTRISQATGCVIMVLHHTGKSDDGYRGSSAIFDACGTVFEMAPVEGEAHTVILKQTKNRSGMCAEPMKLVIKDGAVTATVMSSDEIDAATPANESQAERVARYEAQIPGWYEGRLPEALATLADLKAYCKAESAALVERAAKSLVKQGALAPARDGKKGETAERWRRTGGPDRKGFGDRSATATHAPPTGLPGIPGLPASYHPPTQTATPPPWQNPPNNGAYQDAGVALRAAESAAEQVQHAATEPEPAAREATPAPAPAPAPSEPPAKEPEPPVKQLRAADITLADLVAKISMHDPHYRVNGFTLVAVERAFGGVLAKAEKDKVAKMLRGAGYTSAKGRRDGKDSIRIYRPSKGQEETSET